MISLFEDMNFLEEKPQEGLYVSAFFSEQTNYLISDWLSRNRIPNAVKEASLHTTIVYSRVPIQFEAAHSLDVEVNTKHSSLEVWDTDSGAKILVWQYFSPYLHFRWHEAMKAGATYDYPEFKPHITLSYDIEDLDISLIAKPNFPIVIVGEIAEPLDLGHA